MRLYVHALAYNYNEPWQKGTHLKKQGPAIPITFKDKVFILTTAELATNERDTLVQIAPNTHSFPATRTHICHDFNLALYEVKDPRFHEKVIPLEFGNYFQHPCPQGFILNTPYKITRVGQQPYPLRKIPLLSLATETAIEAEAGTPVFNPNNQLLGIVNNPDKGQIIPVVIIKRFLAECKGTLTKGVPFVPIYTQNLENHSIREGLGMSDTETGVRIVGIPGYSPAHGKLKEDDVILSVEGKKIKNDGTLDNPFAPGIYYDHIIKTSFLNRNLQFSIIRDKEHLNVIVPLMTHFGQGLGVSRLEFETPPTYFLASGMLFQPLNENYFYAHEDSHTLSQLRLYCNHGKPQGIQEYVVLSRFLGADFTRGYESIQHTVIKSANGKTIGSIIDLIEAMEKNDGITHVLYTMTNVKIEIENTRLIPQKDAILLEHYEIPSDRSEDLRLSHSQKNLLKGEPDFIQDMCDQIAPRDVIDHHAFVKAYKAKLEAAVADPAFSIDSSDEKSSEPNSPRSGSPTSEDSEAEPGDVMLNIFDLLTQTGGVEPAENNAGSTNADIGDNSDSSEVIEADFRSDSSTGDSAAAIVPRRRSPGSSTPMPRTSL